MRSMFFNKLCNSKSNIHTTSLKLTCKFTLAQLCSPLSEISAASCSPPRQLQPRPTCHPCVVSLGLLLFTPSHSPRTSMFAITAHSLCRLILRSSTSKIEQAYIFLYFHGIGTCAWKMWANRSHFTTKCEVEMTFSAYYGKGQFLFGATSFCSSDQQNANNCLFLFKTVNIINAPPLFSLSLS